MKNNPITRTTIGVCLLFIGGVIYGIGFGLAIADDNYIIWPFSLMGFILPITGAGIIAITLDKLGIKNKNDKK